MRIVIWFPLWLFVFALLAPAYAQERDYGRTCLALVAYSEARSDGRAGMEAVAQVVLNRLATRQFGDSICDVAMQTGQFEGLSNWPLPRTAHEKEAWAAAIRAADSAVAGKTKLPARCMQAIYFNKTPNSNACKIGSHYFFEGETK